MNKAKLYSTLAAAIECSVYERDVVPALDAYFGGAGKMAPVQGYPQGIPWALHLEAYAVYCQKYGAQPALIDLEGRGCRGGFGIGELDDFIPGWRDKVSEISRLRSEIAALKAERKPIPDDKIIEIGNEVHRAMPDGADDQEELIAIVREIEAFQNSKEPS